MKKIYEVTKTEEIKSTYYIEIETEAADQFKCLEIAHQKAIEIINKGEVTPEHVEKLESSFTTTVSI